MYVYNKPMGKKYQEYNKRSMLSELAELSTNENQYLAYNTHYDSYLAYTTE